MSYRWLVFAINIAPWESSEIVEELSPVHSQFRGFGATKTFSSVKVFCKDDHSSWELWKEN